MDKDQLIQLAIETAKTEAISSGIEIGSEKFRDSVRFLYKLLKELNEEDS